jgi:hypothetical protein
VCFKIDSRPELPLEMFDELAGMHGPVAGQYTLAYSRKQRVG